MTFTFENIVSFFGLLLAGLAALAGVANWLMKKIDGAMNRADRAHEKIDEADKELGKFKLAVAEKYATAASMKEVEERLVAAINNLTKAMNEMPSRVAEVFNAGKSGQSRDRSRT